VRGRVTLADVARIAGVSQTTASFVLSGRREEMRISEEVGVRVLQAVEATGYRPNIVSRSLRTGTTNTIGFVSDTVGTTPFAGHLIWGALDAAREREHLLVIAETEGDEQLEREAIAMMHDRRVDGIVLASMFTRKLRVPPTLLDGPNVLLNAVPSKPMPVTSVIPDEAEAGRTAARTLLEAGYMKGVYVVGAGTKPTQAPKGVFAATQRLIGINEVFAKAGTRLSGGVVLQDWQPKDGYDATCELLGRRPEPAALICLNDRLAVGAYQALADAGLKVGEDTSVISFDDDAVATWLRPQLTSIGLPHYELGRRAVEILLSDGGNAGSGGRVEMLPMPLRARDSVRKRVA
jgi:LacI family transcriptional regulator